MFRVRKHSGITSIPSDFNVDVPVIEVDKKGRVVLLSNDILCV